MDGIEHGANTKLREGHLLENSCLCSRSLRSSSHLREAILCPSPDRAGHIVSSLSRFVNLLRRWGLRRLTSKCLSYSSSSTVTSTLTPPPAWVRVKGGCEAIIHATSHLLFSTSNKPWGIFLDFSNAFNCLQLHQPGGHVQGISNRIPNLSAWMESCYSCRQPLLNLDEYSIRSCCEVQQGDPLGHLGFALTLHSLIEKLHSEVPTLRLNVWYLDDGTLMGSPVALASALAFVEREGPSLGLFLNRSKSLLFVPEEADLCYSTLPPDIPITRRGFSLLGCPAPPDFCDDVFHNRIQKVKASLHALSDLKDAQLECTLLRSCLALPKISFILRACPPPVTSITPLRLLTLPFVKPWSPSSGDPCLTGPGSRQLFQVASCSQVGPLVEQILGLSPSPGILPESVVPALASAAARSDWRVPCDSPPLEDPLSCH